MRHYVSGDNLNDSLTFTFNFDWPVCGHAKRFQVTWFKFWFLTFRNWVCPECQSVVADPAQAPVQEGVK